MTVLVDVANSIIDLRQTVSDFFTTDLYTFVTNATAWFIQWAVVAMWKAKLAALTFSWGVAQQLIINLNISGYLNTAWASLDSRVMSALAFFRIPDAVNMIISAGVTKFVFRFLGF